MLKRYLVALGLVIGLLPITATQAQSQNCNNVDLSTVAALIFQAQTGFSSGDPNTGLDRLAQAEALINVIQSNCGDQPASVVPTATPQPTQAPSETPAETETPIPTEAPTATPVIEGDQTYNSPDELFSATFPASWVSSAGERSLLVGTTENALLSLTVVNNALLSGEWGATIIVNQPDVLVPNAESVESVIEFYRRMFSSDLSILVGDPQPITVNGQTGQGFRYTTDGYSGFFLTTPLDEQELLVLFAIAPLGEDITLPADAIALASDVQLGTTDSE